MTANGLLCFKIGDYTPKEVKETESVKLEELIPKILSKIEGIFRKERMIKKQREIEWKERKRLEEIARIERERLAEIARKIKQTKDDELEKFKDFFNSAHRWNHFVILRDYYEMIESRNDNSMKEWLEWAKKKLDWYNPMLNTEDEILKDVDMDLLEFLES